MRLVIDKNSNFSHKGGKAETPAASKKETPEGQFNLTEILNQMEARANAATPGPWRVLQREGASGHALAPKVNMVNPPAGGGFVAQLGFPPLGNRGNNGDFIAAARSDVPALVAFARLTLDYFSTTARSLRVMGDNAFAQSMDDFVTGLLSESLNVAGAPQSNPNP